MDRKSFVDIENLREFDVMVSQGIKRQRNDLGFIKGDIISITEKIDGSNASIRYNAETGKLESFSRKQVLACDNTLAGFWNWVQTLDASLFADYPNYYVFGEWLRKNKIVYEKDNMLKWYVYSIYDADKQVWLSQDDVKAYCKGHNLTYVHELYYGPFISWDHCREFAHSPMYGERQEGIVVRNMTRLADPLNRYPHVLKIVNEDFAESKKMRVVDPEKEAAKAKSFSLMGTIVTRNRVEKMILKLRDEGILPEVITPQDMKLVAQNLPKRVYEDCVKEEPEIIEACGENAGKQCSSITMSIARDIMTGR